MSKILYAFLAIAFLPVMSCTSGTETVKKPIAPTSDESDMPWNRPTGPEGAGPMGMLNDR